MLSTISLVISLVYEKWKFYGTLATKLDDSDIKKCDLGSGLYSPELY